MEEIGKALLGMGAAGPMLGWLFWWGWQERLERKELAGKLMEITIASTAAVKDVTNAVNALTAKVTK